MPYFFFQKTTDVTLLENITEIIVALMFKIVLIEQVLTY